MVKCIFHDVWPRLSCPLHHLRRSSRSSQSLTGISTAFPTTPSQLFSLLWRVMATMNRTWLKKCSVSHESAERLQVDSVVQGLRWVGLVGNVQVGCQMRRVEQFKSGRTMAVWQSLSGESNTFGMCPTVNVQSFISWTTRECIPPILYDAFFPSLAVLSVIEMEFKGLFKLLRLVVGFLSIFKQAKGKSLPKASISWLSHARPDDGSAPGAYTQSKMVDRISDSIRQSSRHNWSKCVCAFVSGRPPYFSYSFSSSHSQRQYTGKIKV